MDLRNLPWFTAMVPVGIRAVRFLQGDTPDGTAPPFLLQGGAVLLVPGAPDGRHPAYSAFL